MKKSLYLCIVFQQIERPRESAFSLFRECELGHFTMELSRNESMISHLYCIRIFYDIQRVELHQKTLST